MALYGSLWLFNDTTAERLELYKMKDELVMLLDHNKSVFEQAP
ncbi:hypothetical protein [Bacillus paramycoides]|nr:hypothetical protein [Bacillus paramycoides]